MYLSLYLSLSLYIYIYILGMYIIYVIYSIAFMYVYIFRELRGATLTQTRTHEDLVNIISSTLFLTMI